MPPPATKCRSVPIHWRGQHEELLDTLLAKGVIRKQEGVTTFVMPSFMVSKPHDPEKGWMIQGLLSGDQQVLEAGVHAYPHPWEVWAKGLPHQQVLLFRRLECVLLTGAP